MKPFIEKSNRMLAAPLKLGPRGLVLLAALLLLPAYGAPLWSMTMYAPQYQGGLRLYIYSYKLDGGNAGQDVREINLLNHYIGMKEIGTEDFTEFKWLPFAIGVLGLLFLRAAVFGSVGSALDATVIFFYFTLFSLWSFASKLWMYGHNLSPGAPVKGPPFMPPFFGGRQLANFEVYSYPGLAAYALGAAGAALVAALVLAWRTARRDVAAAPAGAG